jgi:hypothetical protein
MAAGQGFKTFATGDVLTAADVNGYLMQGVLVFASAAARDAAITAPQAGQTAYLKDTNIITSYSGSAWVTKSASSPLTTKGDLYGYSTTDARIAVGTNGQVLTADSTAATGVKWASSSGVEPQINLYASGNYLRTPTLQANANLTTTVNTTYYLPIYLSALALDRIVLTTSSTFVGTSVVRLGLYNHNASTGKPSTVYLDAGTVSCTAATNDYLITISNTPTAGIYWLAFNSQTAASTNSYIGTSAGYNALSSQTGQTTASTRVSYWTESSITGAFATAGTLTAATTAPNVYLRMA